MAKVSELFVEIVSKGLQKVQADLNSVKAGLQGAAKDNKLGDSLDKGAQAGGRMRAALATVSAAAKKAAADLGLVRASAVAASKSTDMASGLAKTTAATDKTRAAMAQLGQSIRQVGVIATRAFFAGTAAIAGMVAVASPREWEEFKVALQVLSLHIGRIFLPLLREVREHIEELITWFKNLTDEQRESFLWWTQVGLGVTAFIVVATKLGPLLHALAIGFRVLGLAMKALATSNPILLIIGIVAALIAWLVGFDKIAAAGKKLFGWLSSAFSSVVDWVSSAFNAIWEAIKPFIDQVVDLFMAAWEAIWPILQEIASTIGGLIVSAIKSLIGFIGQLFSWLKYLGPVFKAVFNGALSILQKVIEAYIFLLTLIKKAVKLEFSDALQEANKAVENFRKRLAERKEERQRQKEEPAAPTFQGKPAGTIKNQPDKFTPQRRQQAPELMDLIGAWRKAQQSATDDPKMRLEKERLGLERETRDNTKRIADNTEHKPELGLAP